MDRLVWLCRWCAWPFVLLLRLRRDNGEHHAGILMLGFLIGILFFMAGAVAVLGSDFSLTDETINMKVFYISLAGYYISGLLFSVRKKIAETKFRKKRQFLD